MLPTTNITNLKLIFIRCDVFCFLVIDNFVIIVLKLGSAGQFRTEINLG
jgi:hypothetical protein